MSIELPILVHIVFHPRSGKALDLAQHLHRELNGNPLVPGLRIPTIFCPFTPEGTPLPLHTGQALRDFVIVLADDEMNVDERWCAAAGDVWQACQAPRSRFVPIQLDSAAWPLDERLKGVNFFKAFLNEAESRLDEMSKEARKTELRAAAVRRIVVELCRFLANKNAVTGGLAKAPLKLFLSHTKLDMNIEPQVAKKIIGCLQADQPIDAWVDSGEIETGSKFAEEISDGIADSAGLLAVLTDLYASREWCREEILLAKEKHRPVVVVDALSNLETRSFPYLGNVPRIRWHGDPQEGIDLLIKETLRHLHSAAVLERSCTPQDTVFCRPPEFATLVGLPAETQILYPDPPIGEGEIQRLQKTKIPFSTPLQRLAQARLPSGTKIALSMSESTDLQHWGMDALHLEDCMLDLSRYLLIKGAHLAYGGHLGAEGYTRKLFELVRTHHRLDGAPPPERVINFLGWPIPRPSISDLSKLRSVAIIDERPRPSDVDETLDPDFTLRPSFFPAEKSALHRFAWARGMTEMREYQADKQRSGVIARVVLGGTFGPTIKVAPDGTKTEKWYAGRIPGVLEEILLSLSYRQPVYLIGAFGGAAKLAIDIIRGMERPEATWEYQKRAPHAEAMRKIYGDRQLPWLDYPEIGKLLREKAPMLVNPGLEHDEKQELFDTVDPYRMVELILKGLAYCQC